MGTTQKPFQRFSKNPLKDHTMSDHSYSCCWLHMTWAVKNRERQLTKEIRRQLHAHIHQYAKGKNIFLKTCFVNPDHVHVLIDLPTNLAIEQVAKLLKGESSHWINSERLTPDSFQWQRGYGAFSICPSKLEVACQYIAGQEAHHRQQTFQEEIKALVLRYGLKWLDD
jgi:REP element-mobilizing transposase RayT